MAIMVVFSEQEVSDILTAIKEKKSARVRDLLIARLEEPAQPTDFVNHIFQHLEDNDKWADAIYLTKGANDESVAESFTEAYDAMRTEVADEAFQAHYDWMVEQQEETEKAA